MTSFRTYQECRQVEGWQPVRIDSSTRENVYYIVLVNPWGSDSENICECEGYLYRGTCRHQGEAAAKVCRWREDVGKEQDESDRQTMRCPECGGLTKWQMDMIE